jgi:hypothetical protein
MLVFDRENWPYHRSWCLATALATAAGAIWYVLYGFGSGSWSWPGGGSPPGFAYGVLGGAIILFEMLLWPRKSLWRGWRLGRTKWWMTGHIWLGLLSLPLLLLHGGFHFNPATSPLAAVLMWLLVLVVVSGIFGLVVQQVVPRLMLDRLPAETITSQIDRVLGQYRDDAERMVRATCGEPKGDGTGEVAREAPGLVAIGAVRQVGRVQGKVVQAGFEAGYVPESGPLLAFYRDLIEPYLRAKSGTGMGLPLSSARRAAALFQALKDRLPPRAHPVVDRLADLCDQRRQFDLQARLHHWLFTWLGVHVALSVALLILMAVHVFLALKYV